MVSVGLDYRFCELSFNSVLMLQIVSKCRSVFMSFYYWAIRSHDRHFEINTYLLTYFKSQFYTVNQLQLTTDQIFTTQQSVANMIACCYLLLYAVTEISAGSEANYNHSSPSNGKLLWSVCLHVCMPDCLSVYPLAYFKNHMSKISQNILYMLSVAVPQSSSDNSAICYVLPILRMTSCFHIMEPKGQIKDDISRFHRAVSIRNSRER